MNAVNEIVDASLSKIAPLFEGDPQAINYCKVHSFRYKVDLANISKILPIGSRVLDFGAWPYVMSDALSSYGFSVVAGDIYPEKCLLTSGRNFELYKCDANKHQTMLESDTFDAVIFTEVFEHIYNNPIKVTEELRRILKPGGLLYLTTPNGFGSRKLAKIFRTGCFQNVFSQWNSLSTTGLMGHVTEYTPKEIHNFLISCGFIDVSVTTQNVYKKKNLVEHYFWRFVTGLFPLKKETIVAVAYKPTVFPT